MITMTFNGVDLSEYLRITEVIRTIGNHRDVSLVDGLQIGATVRNTKIGVKEHVVKFNVATETARDMEQIKHELAGILNVDKPVKITYSDEPDKYYMGLPTGSVSIEKLTRWFNRSEIKIIIPDGVAHSTTYRRFDNGTVSSDKIVFDLVNDGNVPAIPIVTVKHNAENGYIGLVNQTGALELGNPEEADTEIVKQSEVLFDYRDSKIVNGLTASAKNVAILNDTGQNLVGTVGSVDWSGRKHLFLQNAGGTTGVNAGSLTWNIPTDSAGGVGSLNDYIWWRQVFWLGATNQYGFIKLTVSDTNGQFLYGVETFKRAQGLGCEYNFMASDGAGGYKMVKRWTFTGTHLDSQNPFNEPRGWSDLKRNDDKVTVFWFGSYNDFIIPEIKGRKSAKVHVAFGAIGNKPLVSRMYLDGIFYRKDFVPVTKDIPNRYSIGSNVVVNCESDTVTVDGLERIADVVDGSTFPTIPTGSSQLEIYNSSWVGKKPTVTVEFEERWL